MSFSQASKSDCIASKSSSILFISWTVWKNSKAFSNDSGLEVLYTLSKFFPNLFNAELKTFTLMSASLRVVLSDKVENLLNNSISSFERYLDHLPLSIDFATFSFILLNNSLLLCIRLSLLKKV